MIRQPPGSGAEAIASRGRRITHRGTLNVGGSTAGVTSARVDDAHGLLRVVAAVAEGHEARGQDLEAAEPAVQPRGLRAGTRP